MHRHKFSDPFFYLLSLSSLPRTLKECLGILILYFETELFSFGFDDLCICPHQPSEHCKCRKPSTYMMEQMAKIHSLNLSECFVIGDRWSDMLAGIRAGAKPILVKTGAGMEALEKDSDKWDSRKAVYIANTILDACKWITNLT